MVSMMICNMTGYMLNVSFAPVAPTASEYFHVNGDMIDMFPLVGMGINVPGLLIGLFLIDKFGTKVGMRFGSSCLMFGALIRGLSTFPAYEHKLEATTKFWITFSGQIFVALGHPFLMTVSTKVSQTWFAEKERIISTAAMAGSGAVGGMIGSVLAPVIVNNDPNNIPILNTVFPVLSILGFLMTWMSVTMEHPPTPPSASAEKHLRETVSNSLTFHTFMSNVKPVIRNPNVIAIIIIMGIGIGVFNMLASQLGQLMCPLGYQEGAAGLAAGLLIMGGLIGSFTIGPIARRFNKQIEVTKVAMPLAATFGVFLAMSLRYADFYPAIVLSLMGFGFCGLGSFPIVLELAVEESYPKDPVISEAFIHASGNVQGLILILLCNELHWKPNSRIIDKQVCGEGSGVEAWDYTPFYYFIMVGALGIAIGYSYFVNPSMKRSLADKETGR